MNASDARLLAACGRLLVLLAEANRDADVRAGLRREAAAALRRALEVNALFRRELTPWLSRAGVAPAPAS